MNDITLHYYHSKGKYLYVNDVEFRLDMTKDEIKEIAEENNYEFIDHKK